MTTENIPLIAECARAGIRLSVAGDKLVVEAPVGVVKPELLERLRRHKAALVEALAARPGAPVPPVAHPVEATTPAAVAPVAATASDAPAVELPPGWPSNTPRPPWWGEFIGCLGNIRLLAAREQMCGDPTCGFAVAILWTDGKTTEWSCPKCGRTSDAQDW
jgi:hypothetical protein